MIGTYPHIFLHIRQVLTNLPPKSVIMDLGTSGRMVKDLTSFQTQLTQHHYFAMGYNPKDNNCDLNGDIQNLPLGSQQVDMVFCLEVIEHLKNPFQALNEIYRVLKPGGFLILTAPFLTSFHGRGGDINNSDHYHYPDFWRFTHQGLELLAKDFRQVKVYSFTNTLSHYLNQLAFGAQPAWLMNRFSQKFLNQISPPTKAAATHRHLLIASK